MSEERGVRSEELIKQLRHCATTSLSGCNDCPYSNDFGCMSTMLLNAADEIERLNKDAYSEALEAYVDSPATTRTGLPNSAGRPSDTGSGLPIIFD